ncbi:MAG: leucyl/phenylalanyl-tRNA--protein transferase [Limnobacter sp.]|uniref:leucyl/phenylalanyl-tRNA--protein transferase n=1 Tax=Limnobacter sp. TaxID=2003368 RepID=UPI00391A5609
MSNPLRLPWIDRPEQFPPTSQALLDPPGLLCASDWLDTHWLAASYPRGIFPWYSPGEPVLWWSTHPRAVLFLEEFKLKRSLKQAIRRFAADPTRCIRLNSDFAQTIAQCANRARPGQNGTWITDEVIQAYCGLHQRGMAHSIEHWRGDEMVGGLYCVSVGGMVYGESMFALETDASKAAFAVFVAWLKRQNVHIIDCQQATGHLMSLGARTLPRPLFEEAMNVAIGQAAPDWSPCTLSWTHDTT